MLINWWRRSLRARVVVTTLVVSAAVVALLGIILIDQVSRGLLDAKRRAAVAEAAAGTAAAQTQLSAVDPTDPVLIAQFLDAVRETVARRGGAAGSYEVVLLDTDPAGSGRATGGVGVQSVPEELRAAVRDRNRQAFVYTSLLRGDPPRGEPALAVGAPLQAAAGSYELYYLFPLAAEQETLALVERTVGLSGLGLVLLLAVVAALVTKQVVTPVRLAARVAGRLADGRLQERMTIRGQDDLARLGTSFNRMAEGLQRQIGELEELSRVQRRFVSDVSHELRTPLTTVRMAADVLHSARDGFPPAVARSAELLQTELDRFEALLVDLLEISRYDARAAVLEPEPVDLRLVIERVAEACLPLAQERGSRLMLQLPAEPVVAEVDPRRVERIVRNLFVNAVEHGEGRPVVVELSGGEDAVAIGVRDRGVGLRPGEAALVFNRFWRADPARARRTGGTGLGLAIALEDAHLHGGWLQAWGEPGKGAQFRLTLPRRAGHELSASPLPLVGVARAGLAGSGSAAPPPISAATPSPAPPVAAGATEPAASGAHRG